MAHKNRRRLRRLVAEVVRVHPGVHDPDSLIRSGRVLVDGFPVLNPDSLVRPGTSITLRLQTPLRGEAKLRAAISRFGVDIRGRVALDLGAAAGGFTRVLLEAGARRVYAVDAGFGQLLGSLRQDPRVVNLERTNVAQLDTAHIPDVLDVVTMDLSYLAAGAAARQLGCVRIDVKADLIVLVKPMFELGLPRPPVEPDALFRAVRYATRGIELGGWQVVGVIESPQTGTGGTIEYLLHARRNA